MKLEIFEPRTLLAADSHDQEFESSWEGHSIEHETSDVTIHIVTDEKPVTLEIQAIEAQATPPSPFVSEPLYFLLSMGTSLATGITIATIAGMPVKELITKPSELFDIGFRTTGICIAIAGGMVGQLAGAATADFMTGTFLGKSEFSKTHTPLCPEYTALCNLLSDDTMHALMTSFGLASIPLAAAWAHSATGKIARNEYLKVTGANQLTMTAASLLLTSFTTTMRLLS